MVDRRIPVTADSFAHRLKQTVRTADQFLRLAQVHGSKGDIRIEHPAPVGFIVSTIGVHDFADDFFRVARPVEDRQKRVIPAAAGLQLFRADHIVRVILPEVGRLDIAHQARVEADPVQFPSGGGGCAAENGLVHRAPQLLQDQAVIAKELIAPVSPQRTAAMVPQYKSVVFCRIIVRAIVDECRQCPGRSHIRDFLRLRGDQEPVAGRRKSHLA